MAAHRNSTTTTTTTDRTKRAHRRRLHPRPSPPAALVLVAIAAATMLVAASLPSAALAKSSSSKPPCLCVFDVDRTLTALQGTGATPNGDGTCPLGRTFPNIGDRAYSKKAEPLTLSDLALNMAKTWCGEHCHLGIISAGKMPAGLDAEHKQLAYQLSADNGNAKMPRANSLRWADASGSQGAAPFLHSAVGTAKFRSVPLIQSYYKQTAKATILDEQVYFYDDIEENVQSWGAAGVKYQAHQISCDSRATDPQTGQKYALGKCGGTVSELSQLKFKKGCNLCRKAC